MTTVVLKDIKKADTILRMLPTCPCFPKINGFEVSGSEMRIVIPYLEKHSLEMSDAEFSDLVKTLYRCAVQGITFGPITKDRVRLQNGKTVLLPNFNAKPLITSGRIENPDSFFTTVQSLASIFKTTSNLASQIHRKKLSAILSLMSELGLKVLPTQAFLPSLGVWRHDKFVKLLQKAQGHIFVPMFGGELFIHFLQRTGRVFTSISDVREEVCSGDKWRGTFNDVEEFLNADLTALALLFPVKEGENYVFLSQTVEMHTFCNEFRKLHKDVKVIEVLEPYFVKDGGRIIPPPRISVEEIEWFLKTLFGGNVNLKTNRELLFRKTGGELFGLSKLVTEGRWRFVDGAWEIYPSFFTSPSAVSLFLEARKLSRKGEKPNLGLELVKTAESVCGRKLESFESLKAFFYKVLGEYENMKCHLERAEKFGHRAFRSAYYDVVLSMNGMNFEINEEEDFLLVRLMKRYALLVSEGNGVEDIYAQVISPLEKVNSVFARRIEAMARNYIGILLASDGKTEEGIDELETSLSISKEYDFKDLEPLIELNLAVFLSGTMMMKSYEKAFDALRHSMNEGLRNIVSMSYLMLATNSMEFGELRKAKYFLEKSREASSRTDASLKNIEARMKVENLELDLSQIEYPEDREELEFLFALYTSDDERIELLLENPCSERLKSIASTLEEEKFEDLDENADYLLSYFLARSDGRRSVFNLKKLGREIYLNNVGLRKIFYEEQLALAYERRGLKRAAAYHLNLARLLAEKFGLERRAANLVAKLKERTFWKESYDLLNFYLSFRYFPSTYEIFRSLALDVASKLNVQVFCELRGVEEYSICATPDGVSWKCPQRPDADFAWVFGKEFFTYLYHMKTGIILVGFKTKNVNMDEALFILDHLLPFYGTHVEKSLADKVSNIDALTKLYSRRYVMRRLTEEVRRSERYNEALSVAMLDVDDFKKVNDTSGHDKGDEVLKGVAKIVMRNVRSIDFVGRYGGEEFLIIFPHTPLSRAMRSCERIRKKVEYARLFSPSLTVSIGVAQLGETDSVDDVIKKADTALYLAKSYGKNMVVPYSEEVEV